MVEKENLKTKLCESLVAENKVKEGDIVKHSFTNQIMKGKKKAVEKQEQMITLTTRGDCFGVVVKEPETSLRIRKLTPSECLKLMGFEEQDFKAMRDIGMTDMQIYHCAGDSIITTVLMGIFGELLGIEDYPKRIQEYVRGKGE